MPEGSIIEQVRAMNPPRYTVAMAAQLVGRSEDTLVRWRKSGVAVPSDSHWFGSVLVPLYTDEDIVKMRKIVRKSKPGQKIGNVG